MTNETFENLSWILDKLHVLINYRVLIFAGMILSLLGGAMAYFIESPRFRSEAILPVTLNVRAAFKADTFLSAVAADSVLLSEAGGNMPAAVAVARALVLPLVEAEKGGHLFVVSAIERSPERSKALLQSVMRQILRASVPIGSDRESKAFQIAELEKSIPEFDRLYSQLEQSVQAPREGSEGERMARALTIVYADIADKKLRLATLRRALEGTSETDIVAQPNLGVPHSGRARVAAIVTAVIAFSTLVLVFLLDLFARAQQFPDLREKLDRLLAFGKKPTVRIHPSADSLSRAPKQTAPPSTAPPAA